MLILNIDDYRSTLEPDWLWGVTRVDILIVVISGLNSQWGALTSFDGRGHSSMVVSLRYIHWGRRLLHEGIFIIDAILELCAVHAVSTVWLGRSLVMDWFSGLSSWFLWHLRLDASIRLSLLIREDISLSCNIFLLLYVLILENDSQCFTWAVSHHIWLPHFVSLIVQWTDYPEWTIDLSTVLRLFVLVHVPKRWEILIRLLALWNGLLPIKLISWVVRIDMKTFELLLGFLNRASIHEGIIVTHIIIVMGAMVDSWQTKASTVGRGRSSLV